MIMNARYRTAMGTALVALALAGVASPVLAQRDPAYATARAAGQVGERVNGYLGIVGSDTFDAVLSRMTADDRFSALKSRAERESECSVC